MSNCGREDSKLDARNIINARQFKPQNKSGEPLRALQRLLTVGVQRGEKGTNVKASVHKGSYKDGDGRRNSDGEKMPENVAKAETVTKFSVPRI